jgi:hypothetical protein
MISVIYSDHLILVTVVKSSWTCGLGGVEKNVRGLEDDISMGLKEIYWYVVRMEVD